MRIGYNVLKVGNGLFESGEFGAKVLHLQTRKTLQAHFEYGVRLLVGENKLAHEFFARLELVAACLDYRHNLVYVGESFYKTFEDMSAFLRFLEVVTGAAKHNLFLMLEIVVEHFSEIENFGFAVHEREESNSARNLQFGVLVKRVEHHLRLSVALNLYNYAHALAVALFLNVRYALYSLVFHKVGYVFN